MPWKNLRKLSSYISELSGYYCKYGLLLFTLCHIWIEQLSPYKLDWNKPSNGTKKTHIAHIFTHETIKWYELVKNLWLLRTHIWIFASLLNNELIDCLDGDLVQNCRFPLFHVGFPLYSLLSWDAPLSP